MSALRLVRLLPVVAFVCAIATACSSGSGGSADSGSGTGSEGGAGGGGDTGGGTASSGSGSGTAVGTSGGSGPGSDGGVGSGPAGDGGPGPGMDGGSETGTSDVDSGACTGNMCCPHALPAHFAPKAHPPGSQTSCDSTTLDTFVNDCFGMTDADLSACTSVSQTPCAVCASTNTSSSTWGAFLFFTASGPAMVGEEYPFNNIGGCVLAEDPSPAGKACGDALEAVTECELAACVPSCPVGVDGSGNPVAADEDALLGTFDPNTAQLTQSGCIEDADTTVCAGFYAASQMACASEVNDAGTLAGNECENLVAAASFPEIETLIGVYCGGGS